MLAQAPHVHEGFLPHGFCYLWQPALLWTHFWSDLLIGLSYVTISFSLAWLVHRARRDIPFSFAFIAFGLFIITCGLTHFMEIWTLWQPVYWLSGGVKVVTAAASVGTAVAMPFLAPRAHATIRDAKLSREREVAAARAAGLAEQNARLQELTEELERRNEALGETARAAEAARRAAEEAQRVAEAARELADEASRVKSDFLATMSHELRTPLNAIGGYTELLSLGLRGPVTPQQAQDLARIARSQRHLLGLIDDVLNVSRLEHGAMSFDLAAVPVVDVLADAVAMIEPQAAECRLALVFERCGRAVVARADRERLRQIALNLLSNAVKYTPEGGRITVSCGLEDEHAVLHVADTGIGIPSERQGEIFEPFVQLDRQLTRRYGGAGLGLAISRALVRGMDGEIVVTSAPGAGSTFTVRLPAAVAALTV